MQDNENKMQKTVCFRNQQQSGILGGQWFQCGDLQLFISKYNIPYKVDTASEREKQRYQLRLDRNMDLIMTGFRKDCRKRHECHTKRQRYIWQSMEGSMCMFL